jgi:hypothetical protein
MKALLLIRFDPMRAILTIVFFILATLANTKEPVNPLAFPLLVESEKIP